jgi:fatty-acyl-CoA synthase
VVVPKTEEGADAEELIALVKNKKGAIQAPKQIDFVQALPQTSLGKIDKKALRARYWDGSDRMVN